MVPITMTTFSIKLMNSVGFHQNRIMVYGSETVGLIIRSVLHLLITRCMLAKVVKSCVSTLRSLDTS
jgi:hypothetical protein